ncbi:MAG: pantoate--beta-alanine ligase, partial [Burkholderiaceae bacterium]
SQMRGDHSLRLDAIAELEKQAANELKHRGWAPDYFAIRRQLDLKPLEQIDLTGGLQPPPEPQMVVLAAARLGQTRLIDNLEVTFA